MAIERPTIKQLQELASRLHMRLTPTQAEEYLALMQANFDAYDLIDALPDEIPSVRYPRAAGYRPDGEENPLNAWYYKTEVTGAATGKLAGRTVALKDNIALAGVPMMNGASTLEGFVPSYDATVATRLLDAGATILGKATCEHFCLSGSSHTSAPAPVQNPLRRGYSAGGSSSGSAALVASRAVDMAIGCDQGGSIRIPSAFCGTYGMKPTHGLVPYTGIMPIEATIDHAGPITANVRDNALMLETISGSDGLDPRQYAPAVETYTAALGKGVCNLKIGLLTEGFQLPNMDTQVAEKVRAAIARLQDLGAIVGEISVPEHHLAGALWSPIGCEGLTAQMMHGNGMGFNWEGQYDVALLDKHAQWRNDADALSPSLKICMFVGQYGLERYHGRYYARAQNIARRARAGYDRALADFDLLVMPTVPIVAQPLPEPGCSITEYISHAFEMIGNTAPQDITGHPAMSIPCGLVDGLPVGMMLVGRHYAESTIYQAAAALEASGDWRMF
ncbi:amidase [Raoultella planticola]|uniref:Amidase n=1 Tax=Raoultella planticola TaxID=575 RepID=A0ABU5LVT8_RAOPL|nr:amidase [Raoultella planticola]MDW4552340.1 amidase [Raoultella planticola]MDZ7444053.1 amidase [Raoultella planticola]MDZ7464072.1 amidase [Raoultella planticola]MDZ7505852.1 amidase [Raoultella planticola]MEA5398288.1 amidase [Raoultella planticola]